MRRFLPVLAALLLLPGCTSAAPSQSTPTAATPTTAAPVYATENQVASVIAKYEADWLETMEDAGTCRIEWVLEPGSMVGASCWLSEQTLVSTSELAIGDLGNLAVPPSMLAMVTSTTMVLQGIVDLDANGVCGTGISDPSSTPECTKAIGTLNFYYPLLKDELDAWGPYL